MEKTSRECCESFAERVLPLVGMAGAISGAFGGASAGAELGGWFPVLCGTLGTILGSALTVAVWCAVTRQGNGAPNDSRHAAQPASPAPSVG